MISVIRMPVVLLPWLEPTDRLFTECLTVHPNHRTGQICVTLAY